MCGIGASFAYHSAANAVDRDGLRRVREHMAARGPDGAGEWFSEDGRVGLVHRRLSIIDLDARADQPMSSADGALRLVFNGEIYNYRALREELIAAGETLRTNSDTEVLLGLYRHHGERLVEKLRGMYAFALWDARRGAMLLGRDPYGIKPLYLADDGWTARIASQARALLAGGGVSRAPETAGHAGFLMLGSVPEPYTLWREIRAVPAGAVQWIDECGPRSPRAMASIAACYRAPIEQGLDDASAVRAAVTDSVRAHLVADVPVGAFLSAGVDSGALVGAMSECSATPIRAATLRFAEFNDTADDEAPLAIEVARHYGVDHATRVVDESEFHDDLPRILAAMDLPSIDGINTWFAAKACRERGLKVAVSGVGGDELFAGYPSFIDVPRWVRWTRLARVLPGLGRATRALFATILRDQARISPKAAGMLELGGTWPGAYLLRRGVFMPWELPCVMDPELAHDGLRRLQWRELLERALSPDPGSPIARVAALESQVYLRHQLLRDTDWAGMAHGLEVRTPLVDYTLLRALAPRVARFTGGRGKALLAGVPRKALPAAVLSRRKTGFSTPIARWLQGAEALSQWRSHRHLARPQHWARRFAYSILAGSA